MKLDQIDRKILRLLQRDANMGVVEIGEHVGLSHTPCWRRIQRLQQNGVIRERVAILDPEKVGLPVSVFANITITSHKKAALAAFERAVSNEPDIVSCHSVTGTYDYLVRVVVPDVASYETYLKERLLQLPNVEQVHSSFALREVKQTSVLPL
jgi:Lrp/AsnC family transcriptional regulator